MAYQSFEMSYQPTDTPYFTVKPMTAGAVGPMTASAAGPMTASAAGPKAPEHRPSVGQKIDAAWSSMDHKKVKYSVITGILFLIVSSPQVYQLTEFLFGRLFTVASPLGCPTVLGLLLHTVVFTVILYALMKFPKL